MAINDDLYWYKNVLKRTISTTIRFYLSISIILSPIILMNEANAVDDGDWWLQREIKLQQNREGYAKRVYGRSARSFLESDPVTAKSRTVTKIAIAETVPTASKVGATMLQRVAFYARNPGVQLLGVYAVQQLIEGIGWVMTEGGYVKYKRVNKECEFLVYAQNGGQANTSSCTARDSCMLEMQYLNKVLPGRNYTYSSSTERPLTCKFTWKNGATTTTTGSSAILQYKNPDFDPNAAKEKIPLTPELLGAAMLGEGYTDPVDPTLDARVNTGLMNESVADAYKHDPTGIGDDLAKEMDDKIKNAPLTPDGQPAPFGDPRYSNPPTSSQPNVNDRSWKDDGGTADGKSEPIKDADGNPTGGQSISIEFPVFCEWAFKMCEWYDDWKKTDEWMKEDPDHSDPEEAEINDDDVSAEKVTLTGSNDCPKDSVQFTVMGQSYTIELPYQPVCNALIFFKPAVLAGADTTTSATNSIR